MEIEEAKLIVNEFSKLTFLYGGKVAFTTEQMKKYQQAFSTVLQELENSIPKKKIEYKIKELDERARKENLENGYITKLSIRILQRLLKEK